MTFVMFSDSLENRGTVRVTGVPMASARLSLRCGLQVDETFACRVSVWYFSCLKPLVDA